MDDNAKKKESTYIPVKDTVSPQLAQPVKIETKAEKFVRLAEYRTKRLLKNIRSLARLSNTASYEYTEAQLDAIYAAIAKEVDDAVRKFKSTKVANEPEFKL